MLVRVRSLGTWRSGCGVLRRLGRRTRCRPGPARGRRPLPPPINQSDDPMLKPFVWRSIGPANMGGRIDDIAVVESDPSIDLRRFRHRRRLEDDQQRHDLDADLRSTIRSRRSAISRSRRRTPTSSTSAPARPTTARARRSAPASTSRPTAARRSSTSGSRTHRPSRRIVVHPKDPNIVYVAALGHLFGPNTERGLYKTTDGGKTWTNTKFIDEDTGFTDVVMDPSNPERPVSPPRTNGGGRRGASTAAARAAACGKRPTRGKTWTQLTGNGLPDQSDHRTNRTRHRAIESVDDLRVDRGRAERRHRRGRQRRRHVAAARAAGAAAVGAVSGASPSRSGEERDLAIGRWRQDVAIPVEPGRSVDVLQPDAHRSHQSRDRVSGRRAVLQDDRWRQDVAAGPGNSAQRPSRDLDRSARTAIT